MADSSPLSATGLRTERTARRLVRTALAALLVLAIALATGTAGATIHLATSTGWTQVHRAGSLPQPRDGHWVTYDSAARTIVLFGGKGSRSRYFNDLWQYSATANKWTRLRPAGTLPPGRFGHGLVYDSAADELITYGGATTNGPIVDTWTYSMSRNIWTRVPSSGTQPAARLYPSMVYDAIAKRTILFGGWTGSSAFNDTWSFDSSTGKWTNLATASQPHPRWGAAMTYDPATGKIILFGGLFGSYDGTSRLNDTWTYDPTSNTWTDRKPTGPLPPSRGYATMTYDTATNNVVLFGGFAGPRGLLADTWAYHSTTNSWRKLAGAAPSRRDFSGMEYDQSAHAIVLFGGLTGNHGNVNGTLLNDTWQR